MASVPVLQPADDAAHLLRRAGFGGNPDEVATLARRGPRETVDALIDYQGTPFDFDDDALLERLLLTMPERIRGNNLELPVQAIRLWWTYRMLATTRPLEEKMVLFWHNHFTSSDVDGMAMFRQNQLYRQHGLDSFRTLALAVSRDPEMLKYLNGNQNFKAHPNENYARELMELFTCGRVAPSGKSNYTEDDVKASARAFSGWNMRGDKFYFNPDQHDDAPKTFMGRTGNFNGDDIVDILVSLPATASNICNKLFRYFAYEDPEPSVSRELVRVYYASGYSIREVVRALFKLDAFWSPRARFALFKSPAEYVVGTIRMAGAVAEFAPPVSEFVGDEDDSGPRRRRGPSSLARLSSLSGAMYGMGQHLLAPATVKGWDGGRKWINTDTIQARAKFANTLSLTPLLTATSTGDDAATMVDSVLARMGRLALTKPAYDAIVGYARTEQDPRARLAGVFVLVLGTPEYQMA